MKKSVLILLFLFICALCSAQNTINGNLKKHVYTLASDSLKGRPMFSTYSKMALNYIYKEFEYTAPTIQDEAMVFEYENQKSRNLYITFEGKTQY